MEPTITTIRTQDGDRVITGEKVGDFHVVHLNRGKWTVTHLLSGYAIAHFYKKEDAIAVATILKNLNCSWEFDNPANMPTQAREVCHEIFLVLSKLIRFAPGNREG